MTERRRLELLRAAYLTALTTGLWFAPQALARLVAQTARERSRDTLPAPAPGDWAR